MVDVYEQKVFVLDILLLKMYQKHSLEMNSFCHIEAPKFVVVISMLDGSASLSSKHSHVNKLTLTKHCETLLLMLITFLKCFYCIMLIKEEKCVLLKYFMIKTTHKLNHFIAFAWKAMQILSWVSSLIQQDVHCFDTKFIDSSSSSLLRKCMNKRR